MGISAPIATLDAKLLPEGNSEAVLEFGVTDEDEHWGLVDEDFEDW